VQHRNLLYDAMDDFIPVSLFVETSSLLAAHPSDACHERA
jgi:hypothetical protein